MTLEELKDRLTDIDILLNMFDEEVMKYINTHPEEAAMVAYRDVYYKTLDEFFLEDEALLDEFYKIASGVEFVVLSEKIRRLRRDLINDLMDEGFTSSMAYHIAFFKI